MFDFLLDVAGYAIGITALKQDFCSDEYILARLMLKRRKRFPRSWGWYWMHFGDGHAQLSFRSSKNGQRSGWILRGPLQKI